MNELAHKPAKVDVPALLTALRIPAVDRRGSALWAACPLPGHLERDPSWSIVADPSSPRNGAWYCFGCGQGGGPYNLVQRVLGLPSWRDAREWVANNVGVPAVQLRGTIVEVATRIPGRLEWPLPGAMRPADWPRAAQDYLARVRGIPIEMADAFGMVATDADYPLAPRSIIVPVVSFGALRTWVARSYVQGPRKHSQARERDGAQPALALWGEPALNPSLGAVLVCEGVYDALSLVLAGFPNAVAVLGCSAITPAKLAAISRCRGVVACTDADPAGERAAEQLRRSLARHCRVVRARPPAGHDFGSAPVEEVQVAITAALQELGT